MTAAPTTAGLGESDLVALAREGDEVAFSRLVEAHRARLHAHCYRMLGSVEDADDAVQEALVRAWRGIGAFEGRSAMHSWLYRIATNASLDLIAKRPKRVLPVDYGPPSAPGDDPGEPLVESVWVEPYPDERLGLEDGYAAPEARYEQRESVELAFIVALQHLPARQRAVLLLREVLGFSASEVAETLETTTAAVNSALQRARQTIEERSPQQSQQATRRQLGDVRSRELLANYLDAWDRRDVDALAAILAEDAIFAMPPFTSWWRGREAVVGFLRWSQPLCPESRYLPTWANGQPAAGWYTWSEERGRFVATAIDLAEFEGERVRAMTSFVDAELFPRFGLPIELPA
jgi:RNA polymerase sigma-70 factor (ECF subfamily)